MLGRAVALFALLAAGAARADNAAEARAHFEAGSAHFAVGEFDQAGLEYQEAYKLKPDPALLYNAAQAYRLAGNQQKALVLYKNYVMFYPKQRNVPDVRKQIETLEEAVASSERAKTQPPTDTAQPNRPSRPNEPPTTTTAPPPTTTTTAPPPATTTAPTATTPAPTATTPAATATATTTSEKKPIYKQWWLWTAVGVVVVAAVVIPVAVVASSSKSPWSTQPDFGPGASRALVQW